MRRPGHARGRSEPGSGGRRRVSVVGSSSDRVRVGRGGRSWPPRLRPAASGAGVSVKVTPNHGLVGGQTVTITGRGLARSRRRETADLVRRGVHGCRPGPHGPLHRHPALRRQPTPRRSSVRHNGTFTAHFRVKSGIIGDGYCATPGHTTCVIGVGNAQGAGHRRQPSRSKLRQPRDDGVHHSTSLLTHHPRNPPHRLLRRRAATPGGCSR